MSLAILALGAAPLGAQQFAGSPSSVTTTNYTHSEWFPNILAPYGARFVPEPKMSNSELLHSLIQNGKLQLSLNNALALALQNNLNIEVARYSLAYAQTDLLRTRAGGTFRGLSPGLYGGVTAFGAASSSGSTGGTGGAGGFAGGASAIDVGRVACCDPVAGVSVGFDQNTTPLNNLVLSGVRNVYSQGSSVTTFFGKSWLTGTSLVVAVDGSREYTTEQNLLYKPFTPSGMTVGFSQPILNGFGYRANAKFIRIADNDVHEANSVFSQNVMTTVANILDLYYDLLYYKQNVTVAQKALSYDMKLEADNKKQVEIGTLAPLEVVQAESQVATDRQNLVVAETSYLQQQELLKTALSKRVSPQLAAAQIEATDNFPAPSPDDIPPLAQALVEAQKNRPEVQQDQLHVRDQDITIDAAKNALLPTFDVFGTYAPTGLSGNEIVKGVTVQNGIVQSLGDTLQNKYPNYSFGVTLQIPIRNRQAQADMTTALLQQRQLQEELQEERNQVAQDVRTADIAVQQARAQIAAAQKASFLAKETLDDERKKFELGESTTLNVVLTEEQYITAEGNEAKARDTYAKALVQFEQATGTTLQKFGIQLADAKTGQVEHAPQIPGEPIPAASQP